MELNGTVFGIALHTEMLKTGNGNRTILSFFRQNREDPKKFYSVQNYETSAAKNLDCASINHAGFVSVVNTFEKVPTDPKIGSYVYRIYENEISIVQIFPSISLKSIRLW